MIYVPFSAFDKVGGPRTFLSLLRRYFDKHKVPYTEDLTQARVALAVVAFWGDTLNQVVKQKVPIVQRLDGVHYFSQHGKAYRNLNQPILETYQKAAFFIFQSEYSQWQCEAILGERKGLPREIVGNGVEITTFYPNKEKSSGEEWRLISQANLRKASMIKPIVEALDSLQTEFKFRWTVVGPVPDELKHLLDRAYINYKGPIMNSDLDRAEVLRKSDIYLHSVINDNFPNSVIEANACGLPVVAYKSGALPTILNYNSELLADVSHDLIQSEQDFKPEKLAAKLKLLFLSYDKYRERALMHSKDHDFEITGSKYLEVLNKFL